MKTFDLRREQFLPITVEQAWQFFSSPLNLATITSPEMKFIVLTQLNDEHIYDGMKIDYKLCPVLNIPIRWRTEIVGVNAPYAFKDRQDKGPYLLWEHTHTFETVPGGVNMLDHVKYALPLGVLGNVAHALYVKNKLKSIFDFRETKLKELFG